MLRGTDISHYQSSIPKGDFTILKATEGLTGTDPRFAGWWETLGERGALRGAYHFAHPDNDPVAEAHHFLQAVERIGLRVGDLLVLDHETPGGSPAHDAAWAVRWCSLVEAQTNIRPVVYTFLSFAHEGRCAGLGKYPLWIADPSRPAGQPRVPAPWSSWVMHQYSETGGIDHDVFNGAREDWLKLGGQHAAPAPRPDPTPTTEDDMIGDLYNGAGAVTPISWPRGKAHAIGFFADTGLAGQLVKLRVAYHKGGGRFHIEHVELDSGKGKTVVHFGDDAPAVDCVSVERESGGTADDVPVAWDAS